MKKKLISLLAIPVMVTLNGCNIESDQIRIPGSRIVRYETDEVKVKLYNNMFHNIFSGSDILEVKDKDGTKTNYIGFRPRNKIEYIEIGGLFGKRLEFNQLSEKEQKKHQEKYDFYLDEIEKQRKKR